MEGVLGRRRWLLPLLLYVGLALVYVPTTSPNPSPDVFTADFAARHLALTGDPVPDISDFPLLDDNIIRETWIVVTVDGREAVGRSPGVIAASVPAYWLLRPDTISAFPGGLTAALLTAGAVTLFFLTLRRHVGDRRALLSAAVLGLTTPLWSVCADGMWPHTLTTLGILGMAWAADRDRWWLVGLFGGVTLWGRLHAAVIPAVLGLALAWWRRRPAIAVRVGLVGAAMLGLMSLWTHWMYGRWDPSSGYRAGDFTDNALGYLTDLANFLGFWVSPDRGLLLWTPLVLLLAPALVRGWREVPDWARTLLVGSVAYFALQAVLVRFSGGDQFYGYRTSLELLVGAAPALALAAHWMGAWARRLLVPVILLQLVMTVPGSVHDRFYVKVGSVWHRNAFVEAVRAEPGTVALGTALALLAAGAFWLVWRSPLLDPPGSETPGH